MRPRGIDWSRANTIRAYTVLRLLHSHSAHERVHPAFRSAIRCILRQANHPRFRAGRNDIAARALQMRQRKPRHQKRRPNIHPDCLIEILDRIILCHRVIEKNACVINEHIEALKFFNGKIDALFRGAFLGNIAGECDRFPFVLADCFGHVLDWIVRQPAYDDARAFFGKLVRDPLTDPRASACNNRHFLLQSSMIGPIPLERFRSHINKISCLVIHSRPKYFIRKNLVAPQLQRMERLG